MSWIKSAELSREDLLTLAELGLDLKDSYVITRYRQEKDGVILLATNMDQLIEMIDDTVPAEATFEIWEKEKAEPQNPTIC